MPLHAPHQYSATPILSGIGNRAWVAAALIPSFLWAVGVLEKYDALGVFLEAWIIHTERHLHRFLQMTDIYFLRKTVWLFSAASDLTRLGLRVEYKKPWADAEQQVDTAMLMEFIMDWRTELFYGGTLSLVDLWFYIFHQNRFGGGWYDRELF